MMASATLTLCRSRLLALNPLCSRVVNILQLKSNHFEISTNAPLLHFRLPLGSSRSTNFILAQSRLISLWGSSSTRRDGFSSRLARKVKIWSIAFGLTFLLIYTAIYNSITTVLLEYLQVQTYSMSLPGSSLVVKEKDATKNETDKP